MNPHSSQSAGSTLTYLLHGGYMHPGTDHKSYEEDSV